MCINEAEREDRVRLEIVSRLCNRIQLYKCHSVKGKFLQKRHFFCKNARIYTKRRYLHANADIHTETPKLIRAKTPRFWQVKKQEVEAER